MPGLTDSAACPSTLPQEFSSRLVFTLPRYYWLIKILAIAFISLIHSRPWPSITGLCVLTIRTCRPRGFRPSLLMLLYLAGDRHANSIGGPFLCWGPTSWIESCGWNFERNETQEMSRFRGRVKWFNSAEGYGFIGRDGQPDVFVHFTGIAKSGYKFLTEEDDVEFDIVQGPRGPQASEVTVLPMLLRESSSEGSV